MTTLITLREKIDQCRMDTGMAIRGIQGLSDYDIKHALKTVLINQMTMFEALRELICVHEIGEAERGT